MKPRLSLLTVFTIVVLILSTLVSSSRGVSAQASQYKEAPMLAEQVKAGKLAAVDQRMPKEPLTVKPLEKIGDSHRVPVAEALGGNPSHAEASKKCLDLVLRAHAGMERIRDAFVLEHRANLLANLHPFFVGVAIRPLVQQPSARREDTMRFGEERFPFRHEIQKPRDDDRVEV